VGKRASRESVHHAHGHGNRAAFNLHTSCDLVILCSLGQFLLYSIKRLTGVPLPGLVSPQQALLRLTTKGEVSQAERCREPNCITTVIVAKGPMTYCTVVHAVAHGPACRPINHPQSLFRNEVVELRTITIIARFIGGVMYSCIRQCIVKAQ
jgi:hypothetical protein